MMSVRKLFRQIIFFIVLSVVLPSTRLSALADWTVLLYVQARNNLARFATQNFKDMAQIGSNENLNILVQWYQPHENGAWRYKIDKGKLNLDARLRTNTDGNQVNDLVDAMNWGVTKYPAKKYLLVLWNHGVGILDPVWKPNGLSFSSKLMSNDPKLQIEDIELFSDYHRGILFNEHSRTYMNNQQLVEALRKIKTNVLKNKKIDVLGMDACLMAMVEVAYQVKDYANYLVASQEVELAHGWDYLTIMHGLSINKITPIQLAQGIVLAYENYYKRKIKFYTQSAIALENMSYVKESINQIVCNVDFCKKQDKRGIQDMIREARKHSVYFSTRSYVDLHSFYSKLHELLLNKYFQSKENVQTKVENMQKRKINNKGTDKKFEDAKTIKNKQYLLKAVKQLNESLLIGMKTIESSVIANTVGKNFSTAKGLSVYYPGNSIDNSYHKTEFAKDCLWFNFLKDNVGQ